MVRFFLVFLSFVLLDLATAQSQLATGQDFKAVSEVTVRIAEAERSARTNLLAAEKVVYAANQAIDAAAVIVSSVDNDRLIHHELKRLAAGIPGGRAIIVVGHDGTLLHDSYKYPVAPLDLADRSYFREAMVSRDLKIGAQVVGRTSGAAFVPLVKRLGDLTYVVVATPYSLVDLQSECVDCWSLMLKGDGSVVTMFPPEARVSTSVTSIASKSSQEAGSRVVRYRNSVVALAWRKSPDFPFVSVSVRGLPDTAAVDVDLN